MPTNAMTGPERGRAPLPVLAWHWGREGAGSKFTFELTRELHRRDDLDVEVCAAEGSQLADDARSDPGFGSTPSGPSGVIRRGFPEGWRRRPLFCAWGISGTSSQPARGAAGDPRVVHLPVDLGRRRDPSSGASPRAVPPRPA